MIGRSNQRCTAVIGEESSPVAASAWGICLSNSGPSSLPSCFQETAKTTWSKRRQGPSPGTMPRKRLPSTSNLSIRVRVWSFAPRRVSQAPARSQISPSGIRGTRT